MPAGTDENASRFGASLALATTARRAHEPPPTHAGSSRVEGFTRTQEERLTSPMCGLWREFVVTTAQRAGAQSAQERLRTMSSASPGYRGRSHKERWQRRSP